MMDSPLARLVQCGQSLWLDCISRRMLLSGELVSLIQEDGVSGASSNAAGLEQELSQTGDYDAALAALARQGVSAAQMYETLVIEDVRLTADLLRPLYETADGRDGYVSLEVSPHLAHDSVGMLREARRFWGLVDRPNLFVRIPGTREGVAALRQLTLEGINVNIALIFGVPRYRAVAEAYLDGLSERAARGLPLERVASVAAVFLNQIDLLVDPLLSRLARREGAEGRAAAALKGEVAVAFAKALHCVNRTMQRDDRYLALAARGARPQRLLWVCTGSRDPSSGDLKYPEALIGPDTVHCMPLDTMKAYREQGRPVNRLDEGVQEALGLLERLCGLGIDLNRLARQLEDEGVERLARPYDSLLRNIELKRLAALG